MQQSAMRVCPYCSTQNPASEEFCEQCGGALLAIAQKPISVPVPTPSKPIPPQAQPHCPRCNHPVEIGKSFCGKCGERLMQNNLEPGMVINDGHYVIERAIGQGGLGAVYLAIDKRIDDRKVVIKALLHSHNAEEIELSRQERRALSRIKHPNIVQIYDFIEVGTFGYIVMEYVEGVSLEQILKMKRTSLKAEDAVRVVLGILPALLYLHQVQVGMAYNDLKPGNIIQEQLKDGSVIYKLIDLGAASELGQKPKHVYGTLGYAAPELVNQGPSIQTDLYSVAKLLLHLVTRHLDFLDNPHLSTADIVKRAYAPLRPKDYPVLQEHPSLALFLEKGLRKEPKRRFANGQEFLSQLSGVYRQVAGEASDTPFVSNNFAPETATIIGVHGPRAEVLIREKNQNARKALQAGDAALRSGSTATAEAHYQQSLVYNAQCADAFYRLAELRAERRAFAEAQDALQRVVPHDAWLHIWTAGRVAEMSGHLDQARRHYQAVREELPGELAPLLALGRVEALQHDYEEALACYRQIIFADPASMQGVLGLTNALMQVQPVSEAKIRHAAAAVEALSTHLEDARYYKARGDLCYAAWKLVSTQGLPKQTTIVGLPELRRDALAQGCEQAYREYLRRAPNTIDRELLIRRCLSVRPWRLWHL